jgi:trk system potassium uptake protein TrkH
MRFRYVIRQLGYLVVLLSVSMTLAWAWSVWFARRGGAGEYEALWAFMISAAAGATVGGVFILIGASAKGHLARREAMLLVAASWVVGAALCALPFRVWAARHTFAPDDDPAFTSYVNCYFEAMSGLTTTGASVLGAPGTGAIESIPMSLLFWRAFTHWLGGLGIVVLFVAVLPILGVGGKRLFRAEAPGPTKEGVRPRIQTAARALWFIYLGLTILEVLALRLAGMGWFDSFCHTFATLATGGFSTKNASIGHYGSVAIESVIILFMIAAGVNFALYYRALGGNRRLSLRDPELRAYVSILLVSTIVITLFILPSHKPTTTGAEAHGFANTVRYAAFQVVSIQTTTGFCTADTDHWPPGAKIVLLLLMFVGASAGSTGGGIKVMRIVILAKALWSEIENIFRPHVIRTIRLGGTVIEPQMKVGTLVYVLWVVVIFAAGSWLIHWFELYNDAVHADAITCVTACAATLNNIGPGFGLVGATQNYGFFSVPSKVVMCLLMALGRLELYAFLVLITPRFWREE